VFDFDLNREELEGTFLAEASDDIAALEELLLALEGRAVDAASWSELLRRVHNLKGNASCVGFQGVATFAHAYEDLLERASDTGVELTAETMALLLDGVDTFRRLLADREAPFGAAEAAVMASLSLGAAGPPRPEPTTSPASAPSAPRGGRTLRVAAEKLNRLLDLVSEMAIARGRAHQLLVDGASGLEGAIEVERHVDKLQAELQELVMRARMVPLGPTFRGYARTVRDLAESHGKAAHLLLRGEDVELDSAAVEILRDPLSHLIRNAIDHGVETADERAAQGKPPLATLTLEARHDGGSILISFADDGAGLDTAAIAAHAAARGLAVEGLGEAELQRLIFEPGFSTADEVTELSGRGVGLDVVRRAVEALRGSLDVHSRAGAGTTFSLRLPLTVSVIDGFVVGVGDETYLLPMDSVLECRESPADDDEHGTGVLLVRDEVVPWVRLRHQFALDGQSGERESVVVVEHGGQKAGLVVDALAGTCQAVIKPLGSHLPAPAGVAGASILASGRVALVLDVGALLRSLAPTLRTLRPTLETV
jgi:two-component system chemotaxis sensor kinase CheA